MKFRFIYIRFSSSRNLEKTKFDSDETVCFTNYCDSVVKSMFGSCFSTVSRRGFVVVSKKKYTTYLLYVSYIRFYYSRFVSFVRLRAFRGNRVPKFSSRSYTVFVVDIFSHGKLAGTLTYKTRNEFTSTIYECRPSA